jgi:hypothetical protein
MTFELNKFEIAILKRLSIKYPYITDHIPYLLVESRVYTGVGMYVNFSYSKYYSEKLNLDIKNTSLSTNESIEIDSLNYGLGYEVDISNGKIKFIEVITYGENWDGKVSENFVFLHSD